MTTKQIEEVLPLLIEANYYGLEMWGGATLDASIRFLLENPWERLDRIAEITDNRLHLTALARGINLFGYNPYPDEVVFDFNKLAVESGITIMRIFDALNDLNNLKTTINAVKEANGMVDCGICYTTDPELTFGKKLKYFFQHKRFPEKIFDVKYYVDKAINIEKMGADIITIKDMAGLIHPKMAYELIKEMKKKVSIPINLHSHCTPGYAVTSMISGMLAGVDILDVASFPFSGGPSHPAVEIVCEFARKLGIDLGLNEKVFPRIRQKLVRVRTELSDFDKYSKYNPYFSGEFSIEQHKLMDKSIRFVDKKKYDDALITIHELERSLGLPAPDDDVRLAQIPGGMYSNLLSQLEQSNISHLLGKVLEEVPKVRLDAGLPPLVTPTSQIVGVQAVRNVMLKRQNKAEYSDVTSQYIKLVRGEYGQTPKPIDTEFRKKITGSVEEKRFDTSDWEHTDSPDDLVKSKRDQMLLDLFPVPALNYLKHRKEQEIAQEKARIKKEAFENLVLALSDNYLV